MMELNEILYLSHSYFENIYSEKSSLNSYLKRALAPYLNIMPLDSYAFKVIKYDVLLKKIKTYLSEEELEELNNFAAKNGGEVITISSLMDFFLIYDVELYSGFLTYEFEDAFSFIQVFICLLSCRRMYVESSNKLPKIKLKNSLNEEFELSLFQFAQICHISYKSMYDEYNSVINDMNSNIDHNEVFIGNILIEKYNNKEEIYKCYDEKIKKYSKSRYVFSDDKFSNFYDNESKKEFYLAIQNSYIKNVNNVVVNETDFNFIENIVEEYVLTNTIIPNEAMIKLKYILETTSLSEEQYSRILEISYNNKKECFNYKK